MFLTKEEFEILKALKKGLNLEQTSQLLEKRICTNDPRVDSLFQKYGADNRIDLILKADIKKVEVCEKKDMPYFKYDEEQLVKKIPVCKKDVEKLVEIFENIQDEEKIFNLVYCANTLNEYMRLDNKGFDEYVYQRVG